MDSVLEKISIIVAKYAIEGKSKAQKRNSCDRPHGADKQRPSELLVAQLILLFEDF